MREIRFRELLPNKNFHYWGFLRDGAFIGPSDPKGIHMQLTGLTDKNDKEIYEGDILDSFSGKYRVSFNNGCFTIIDDSKHFTLFTCPKNEIQVIGNIHDNPELLTTTPQKGK